MVSHNKPEVILYRITLSFSSDCPNRGKERRRRERVMSVFFINYPESFQLIFKKN
jgi:hypothetical protein